MREVLGSLAVSQDRTENGTGLTPPEGVITEPYHLPECELATGVYDDRADCICDALRACELRVRTEPFDVAYLAGLDAAAAAIHALKEKP